MSGSIAAIAAYNGTGTQGYQTTDKTIPGVKSIFWNENDTDKYYVNGSALIDIPANNSEVNYPTQTQPVIFTFPNDVDAIGELYLSGTRGDSFSEFYLPKLINSIELCVGNQIIASKNATEINADAVITPSMSPQALVILLDFFYKDSYSQNYSYLAACANNQTLQLKVYPQTNTTMTQILSTVTSPTTAPSTGDFSFSLYARVYSMVNDERNFLRNQVIPKLFPVTQYSDRISLCTAGTTDPITINCDSFNIDASTITVYVGYGWPSDQTLTLASNAVPIFNAELILNSTSYSGISGYNFLSRREDGTNDLQVLKFYLSTKNNYSLTKSDLVPLSKYDSIRIKLYPNFTPTQSYSSVQVDRLNNTLTAVAEGYCTALYQNGAVTFNNY
jgi:hypothetical protein